MGDAHAQNVLHLFKGAPRKFFGELGGSASVRLHGGAFVNDCSSGIAPNRLESLGVDCHSTEVHRLRDINPNTKEKRIGRTQLRKI